MGRIGDRLPARPGLHAGSRGRPLKRAIDRHLLAPLAQTIVNRQVPAGDQFLFVTQRDRRLAVDFVDPDATGASGTDPAAAADDVPEGLSLRAIVLQPNGVRTEFAFLFDRIAALQDLIASDAWRRNKEETLAFLELPDFWSSPERFEILGQVEHIDRMEAALVRVGFCCAASAARAPIAKAIRRTFSKPRRRASI